MSSFGIKKWHRGGMDSTLENGFDYKNQAWVSNGKYERCGHPEDMDCKCYGRIHAGDICTTTGFLND